MQTAGDWDGATRVLQKIARDLEAAGADCVLICTNTMHKLADAVQSAIGIPLLNIIDICAHELKAAGARRPLLLATRYTMEHDFYRERMSRRHGLVPLVPEADDRTAVHDIIFSELCCGIIRDASRQRYMEIIARGRAAGADSVILGLHRDRPLDPAARTLIYPHSTRRCCMPMRRSNSHSATRPVPPRRRSLRRT